MTTLPEGNHSLFWLNWTPINFIRMGRGKGLHLLRFIAFSCQLGRKFSHAHGASDFSHKAHIYRRMQSSPRESTSWWDCEDVIYITTVPKILGHRTYSGEDTAPPSSRSQQIIHFHGNQHELHVFSGTVLLVHAPQRQPDACVWPLQQTMSLLIRVIFAVPELARQDCRQATWATMCQMHQRTLETTPLDSLELIAKEVCV